MCELDDRASDRIARGWLGLQLHTGPPMRVQFKDIFLKRLRTGAPVDARRRQCSL